MATVPQAGPDCLTTRPMFHARTFTLLQNYQAITLPYDGAKSLPATRLYLKPHYLARDRSYWRQRDAGEI